MDKAESADALSPGIVAGVMEMPVENTVSVVLSWCHQRAWDALLNQK